ncbi:MAG: hypothetical protein D6B26_06930 [Spirochaetaceae bacterium]|nr:MAG: hypothetical protein D6B26_06930 [Spirochaetaceae bacterium]
MLRDSSYNLTEDENGIGDEEFSIERIHRITEAIQSGSTYVLQRQSNPDPDELLEFDFSDIEPTAENTVLGLIAIEKVLRMYTDPMAGADDKVVVDRVVDDFLKQVFHQYSTYFGNPVESSMELDYRQYAFVKEDDQYDDLTLLAIKRKK